MSHPNRRENWEMTFFLLHKEALMHIDSKTLIDGQK